MDRKYCGMSYICGHDRFLVFIINTYLWTIEDINVLIAKHIILQDIWILDLLSQPRKSIKISIPKI